MAHKYNMGHNPCKIEIQPKIGNKAGCNMYLNCTPDIIDFRFNNAKQPIATHWRHVILAISKLRIQFETYN